MNRERAKQLLPYIQGFAEGKTIQTRTLDGNWFDIEDPYFSGDSTPYRFKPEPREAWVITREDEKPLQAIYETQKEAEHGLALRKKHSPDVKWHLTKFVEQI